MSREKLSYKFVYDYIKQRGYELLDIIYKNNSTKLTLRDKDGYYYYIHFNSFKNCKNPDKFEKRNPYTVQNIKLWCKLNNKQFELISDTYSGNNKKLQWRCLAEGCMEIFESSWGSVDRGSGCSYCSGQKTCLSNCLATINPKLASEWHPTKNGDLTPYDVRPGSGLSAWWKCSEDVDHEWETIISSRGFNNNNCPYCSGFYPSRKNNLLIHNPILCEEWNYEKNDKPPEEYTPVSGKDVWWKCKECNHEWTASISNRNGRDGIIKRNCPECCQSKGEIRIREFLRTNNYIFESEYEQFKDLIGLSGGLLRFDFIVFKDPLKTNIKLLIEFDGEYHYKLIKNNKNEADNITIERLEKQKYHDKLKDTYCKLHNIKLLRIKYDQFDKIEEILTKELQNK